MPAAPDPNIDAGIEVPKEIGAETKEALLGLRIEMRAMHRHIAVELDGMRKMRTAQRRGFGWLIGIMLGGMAGLLGAMAHGFGWR
jgi:hypothetical protein